MLIEQTLTTEKVRHLHPKKPIEVGPGTTVLQAISRMRERRTGCVLVSEGGKLLGVFTERDLLLKVMAGAGELSQPVRDHMTENPVTLDDEASISEAILLMYKGGYRHLPVVDGEGRAAGVISIRDITEYIIEQYPTEIYNLPPDPDQFSAEENGG